MKTTKPIKSIKDVESFKQYYLKRGEYRNYLLVSVCLNSALRISDVLALKWENVYNSKARAFKTHISLTEKKTGKRAEILINTAMLNAFGLYLGNSGMVEKRGFIFKSNNGGHITRMQAYRIIHAGGESIGLDISCHSLRKTFGYHAWKKGVPPVMLMKIYNHSTFSVTKRYLGIEQEDKDAVYESVSL